MNVAPKEHTSNRTAKNILKVSQNDDLCKIVVLKHHSMFMQPFDQMSKLYKLCKYSTSDIDDFRVFFSTVVCIRIQVDVSAGKAFEVTSSLWDSAG